MQIKHKTLFRWCWITLFATALVALIVFTLLQVNRLAIEALDDQVAKFDPNDLGPEIREPLVRAAADNEVEEVERLLNKGHDVNAKSRSGFTALGIAIRFKRTETVEVLLKHNADVSIPDRFGMYPLDSAVQGADIGENIEIVRLLVQAGADPDFKSPNSIVTPREYAQGVNAIDLLEAMKQAEEDRDLSD